MIRNRWGIPGRPREIPPCIRGAAYGALDSGHCIPGRVHGQRVAEIKGLKEPQGVLYVQANQNLYVSNGADGTVRSFDARTMQAVKTVVLGDDAGNLRFDAKQKLLLAGYGRGAIATLALDLASKGDVKLSAHPESFQLSADGQRLFVNLPRSYSVAVVDRGKQTVSATWKMLSAHANFPMALDEEHHRLFIACHMPSKLQVFDTNTGGFVAKVTTVGDADDLFYDPSRDSLYVIGGEGYVDVLHVSRKNQTHLDCSRCHITRGSNRPICS